MTQRAQWFSMGEVREVPAGWHQAIGRMDFAQRAVCYQLLKTRKFRNGTRDALKQTLIRWLSASPKDRSASPFSEGEWRALGAESF